MRLICGLLRLDGGEADGPTLDRMAAAMIAAGQAPAQARRLAGPLGLGLLDFTAGRQGGGVEIPERDGWTIAADARLDRTGPDMEAAFATALARHGADFPDHVDGDFAVALWRRDQGLLHLGRDFIGVRPLAWTWRPGRWFAFASLPKGLHGAGLAGADIDPLAIADLTARLYFAPTDTGFTDIAYLEAGHSLTIRLDDPGPPRPHRAYRPDPAQVGRWRGTPEAAADRLRQLITDAVETRLPKTGPVACHLSGGLDSSAITVLVARAARRGGQSAMALSMIGAERAGPVFHDERPLIAAILEQEPDLVPVTVPLALNLPWETMDPDWPDMTTRSHDDQMAAAAAAFGADRILSGAGGDEGATYNGANLYARLLKEGHIGHLLRELPARARKDGISLSQAIRSRLIRPLLPSWVDMARRRLRGRPHGADPDQGLARYLQPAIRSAIKSRLLPRVLVTNSPGERVTAFTGHNITSRCTLYAIMAARHGLSVSFPLLDRRVVDFMLSLPVPLFLADGQSRQPFRRAMRGILPDPVRLAPEKLGSGDDRFLRYAALKADLLAALDALRADPPPVVTRTFDLDAIRGGLEQLPDPAVAEGYVQRLTAAGAAAPPRWPGPMAVRALLLATHLARFSPTGGARP